MARKSTPPSTQTEVLTRSRRRCALCFGLDHDLGEKPGQIAHLDQNASNANFTNLCWLCLPHHDRYDSQTRQSKGLTKGEVLRYRDKLYAYIEAGGALTSDAADSGVLVTSAGSGDKDEGQSPESARVRRALSELGRKQLNFLRRILEDGPQLVTSLQKATDFPLQQLEETGLIQVLLRGGIMEKYEIPPFALPIVEEFFARDRRDSADPVDLPPPPSGAYQVYAVTPDGERRKHDMVVEIDGIGMTVTATGWRSAGQFTDNRFEGRFKYDRGSSRSDEGSHQFDWDGCQFVGKAQVDSNKWQPETLLVWRPSEPIAAVHASEKLAAFIEEGQALIDRCKDYDTPPPVPEINDWVANTAEYIEGALGKAYVVRFNNFHGLTRHADVKGGENDKAVGAVVFRIQRLREFLREIGSDR